MKIVSEYIIPPPQPTPSPYYRYIIDLNDYERINLIAILSGAECNSAGARTLITLLLKELGVNP